MLQPNLELLGETVRLFREKAQPTRISQFRLAALMHWEGTAPIVEIEKGRRHPRPETINALGEALQLSPADIAYLHGLAGYRDITAMPPLQQIERVLQAIEPELAVRAYPAYVMDYQFRFWMMNSATAAFQGGALDGSYDMLRRGVDGLSMTFDSRLLPRNGFVESEAVERQTLFRFKAYNLYRRHEPFYLGYPACMRERLTAQDYARFVQRWNEVDVRMQDVYPVVPHVTERLGRSVLTFQIHMVDIHHLDRLFFIAYYEPQDDAGGNRQRCEAFFNENAPPVRCCLRLGTDAQQVMRLDFCCR